jgi:hypothetical protein
MKHLSKSIDHPDVYFSNTHLEKETQYFLYVGSLRNYGPNVYLAEALSRIYGRKFKFISIIQDILKHYSYENQIVINPLVHEMSAQRGRDVSCRIPTRPFMACVSQNSYVHQLVRELLDRQEKLYIYMYQSLPEMTLDQIPGVYVLGPDSQTADRLNNRIYQYRSCRDLVPMPDFRACKGLEDLLQVTENLRPRWTEGIFVSKDYTVGGLNSIVAHSREDITGKYNDDRQTYFISRYIPHVHDPTVLAVVANEEEIYIAGVADQFIEHDTRFVGSTYPTTLTAETVFTLNEYTRTIGRWLAGEGFRGIFGCDYIVDAGGQVFFIEVNARKQGTTMEFCCTLENTLPPDSAMLPELEYYAVTEGRFPENTVEMMENPDNIHWGTYYFKNSTMVNTHASIAHNNSQRKAFQSIAENKRQHDCLIMDHIGSGFLATEKSFLARIVALGRDPAGVQQGLEHGKKIIAKTIKEL